MLGAVLIVEDESAIADTLIYALKTEGYAPHHAALGADALDRLRAGTFDLVILDVGLPDISGFEVLRRLRTFSDIPALFLTARSDEVDRIVGLELGADDYVAKPFSPREVVARVRGILRRTGRAESPSAPSRFEVDDEAHRIRYRGTLLDLTRYEHLLLKRLLAHPERVFTRAELMESVWAGAEDSSDRTVDAHIKTLRAKLRLVEPQAEPIQTHRGLGYSLGRFE